MTDGNSEFPAHDQKGAKLVLQQPALLGCEMFDMGTAQGPIPLKTSERFCSSSRAPTSCKQFLASSSSPGSCRRHGLRCRRMCFTRVSGMPRDIRYCITNNGGDTSNLKLYAMAVLQYCLCKQARKRCSRNFFLPCTPPIAFIKGISTGAVPP